MISVKLWCVISVVATLLVVGGCAEESPEPDLAADSVVAVEPDEGAYVPGNPVLPGLPPELAVRRGACPFECCQYGRWTALTEIPVLADERGDGPPIFVMQNGDRFRADSGNVHVTEVARVVVLDSIA